MNGVWTDVRLAVRQWGRTPGVAAVALLSLAVGLGAVTTVFTVANALFLRPPPFPQAERLVTLHATAPRDDGLHAFSWPTLQDLRTRAPALAQVGGWADRPMSFGELGQGTPEVLRGQLVSGGFFPALQLAPALGRLLQDADDAPGAEAAVVLSHGLWVRRFASDPHVVGRAVRLNGQPFTVVGVAPPGFHGPSATIARDAWVSVSQHARLLPGRSPLHERGSAWLEAVARLAPGASHAAAQAQLHALGAALAQEHPEHLRDVGLALRPLGGVEAEAAGALGAFTGVLMAATWLLLLIACVNVAGVMLARALARRREVAVRLALGASRGQLVRQQLTEVLVLFGAAGAGGWALSRWAAHALMAMELPIPVRLAADLGPDLRVAAFAAALTLGTGLLFGLLPALRGAHAQLMPALRSDAGGGRRGSRLRGAFVVGQLALTLVLLASAGLLGRALQRARGLDLGFSPQGVVLATIDANTGGMDPARGAAFHARLLERLRATPGVQEAALGSMAPSGLDRRSTMVGVPGHAPPEGEPGFALDAADVTPGYLALLRMPLAEGRDVAATDGAGAPRVALVNQAFARRFFPGGSPLGARLTLGEDSVEVVGVVRDARVHGFGTAPRPALWLPLAQSYSSLVHVFVRSSEGEAPVRSLVAAAVEAEAPGVAPLLSSTLERYIGLGLLPQRLAASAASALGALGLLLASLGLYGIVAYAVGLRARELGIRMALGAQAASVVGLVLRQGLVLALVGIGVGTALAVAAGAALQGLLLGVSPADPLALGGVAVLLAAVALLASFVPARRAARVDPVSVLRAD